MNGDNNPNKKTLNLTDIYLENKLQGYDNNHIQEVFMQLDTPEFKSIIDVPNEDLLKKSNINIADKESLSKLRIDVENLYLNAGLNKFHKSENEIALERTESSAWLEPYTNKKYNYEDKKILFTPTTDMPGYQFGMKVQSTYEVTKANKAQWSQELMNNMHKSSKYNKSYWWSELPFVGGDYSPNPVATLEYDYKGYPVIKYEDGNTDILPSKILTKRGSEGLGSSTFNYLMRGVSNAAFYDIPKYLGSLIETAQNQDIVNRISYAKSDYEKAIEQNDYEKAEIIDKYILSGLYDQLNNRESKSYRLQNISYSNRWGQTYEQEIKPWWSSSNFAQQAGEAIGQTVFQIGVAAATRNPYSGIALGSIMAANEANELAKENNISHEYRMALYLGVGAVTFGTEKLLMKIGLSPVLKSFGQKSQLDKANLQAAKEIGEKYVGKSMKEALSGDKKTAKTFMNKFMDAYSQGSIYAPRGIMKGVATIGREGGGEVLQESVLERAGHQGLYTLYDYINKDQIVSSKNDILLYEANKKKFVTDYDTRVNGISNWMSSFYDPEAMLQEGIFAFIGGAAGGSFGIGLQKLSNNPGVKKHNEMSVLDMLIIANGDMNKVLDSYNRVKDKMNYTVIGKDKEGNNVSGANTNIEFNANELSQKAFEEELQTAKVLYDKMGLKGLDINGPMSKDINFRGEVLHNIELKLGNELDLQTLQQEYNTLKESKANESILKQQENKISEKQSEIDIIQSKIDEFTKPDQLYRDNTSKISKAAREKILAYDMSYNMLMNDINFKKELNDAGIRIDSKEGKNLVKKYALEYSNIPFFNTNRYSEVKNEIGLVSKLLLSSKQQSLEASTIFNNISEQLNSKLLEIEIVKTMNLPNIEDVQKKVNNIYEKYTDFETDISPEIMETEQDPEVINNIINKRITEGTEKEKPVFTKEESELYSLVEGLKTSLGIKGNEALNLKQIALKQITEVYQDRTLYIDLNTKEGQDLKEQLDKLLDELNIEKIDSENSSESTINKDYYVDVQTESGIQRLNITEFNSKESSIYETLLSLGNEALNSLNNNLFTGELDIDGNKIIEKENQLKLQNAKTQLDILKTLKTLYDYRNLLDKTMEITKDEYKKGYNPNEISRSYNEDISKDIIDENNNKLAKKALEEKVFSEINKLSELSEDAKKFFNEVAEKARTRDAIYSLEFWNDILLDGDGNLDSKINQTLGSKEVGIIGLDKMIIKIKELYNTYNQKQQTQNNPIDQLTPQERTTILTITHDLESAIYKSYNNNGDVARDNIREFINNTLDNDKFKIVNNINNIGPNTITSGYFGNFKIGNLVDNNKQGLKNFGSNFVSTNSGTHNPVYHWTVNYLHRMINLNVNETKDVLNNTLNIIAKDKNIESLLLENDVKMPSVEQIFSTLDIMTPLQSEKDIDNYVFQINDMLLRKSLGMMYGNKVLTLSEAQDILNNFDDIVSPDNVNAEDLKSNLNAAVNYYDSMIFSKTDVGGNRGFMERAVMQIGVAGTGKTMMVGFNTLMYAIINGHIGNKALNITIVSPDNRTKTGIGNKSKTSIEKYIQAYNSNIDKEQQIKLGNINIIGSNKVLDGNYKHNTDLIIFDEAGRYSDKHILQITELYNKSNETKNSPFYFLGDNQQITYSPDSKYFYLPMQSRMMNTIPLQHSFRTGNTEVYSIVQYYRNAVLNTTVANTSLDVLPSLYMKIDKNNNVEGGRYYDTTDKVIKQFLKRNKDGKSKKSVLIFVNQEHYNYWMTKYPSINNKEYNVRILYNNIEQENEINTVQGEEFEEVYVAINPNIETLKTENAGYIEYNNLMTAMYTSVSRAVKGDLSGFVALIGEESKNKKESNTFGILGKIDETNMQENIDMITSTRNNISIELSRDKDVSDLVYYTPTIDEKTQKQKKTKNNKKAEVKEDIDIEDDYNSESIQYKKGDDMVSGFQTGVIERKGTKYIKLDNGDLISFDSRVIKTKAEYDAIDKKRLEANLSTLESRITNNNLPVLQGSISADEYNNFNNKSSLFYGEYKAAKVKILSNLSKVIIDVNNADAIKIKLQEEPTSYMHILRGEPTINKKKYSPVMIMAKLDNINFVSLNISEEVQSQLESNITEDGYIQIGYLTKETEGKFPTFYEMTKGNGITMSVSEFDSNIHNEGNYLQYERHIDESVKGRSLPGTDSWIVPGKLFEGQVKDIVSFKDDSGRTHYRVTLNSGTQLTMDTLKLTEKMDIDPEYRSQLLTDIETLLALDNNITETDYRENRNNLIIRLASISSNATLIGPEASLKDNNVSTVLSGLKVFAENLKTSLETNEGIVNELYVPAYAGNLPLVNNMKAGGYDALNMFYDVNKNVSDKDVSKEEKSISTRNKKFYDTEQVDEVPLTKEIENTVTQIIGKKEYGKIQFKDPSSFGKTIAGIMTDGTIKIRMNNGMIQRDVIEHEVFHKVLNHGITLKSKQQVLEDYRSKDMTNRSELDYDTLEEMMTMEAQSVLGDVVRENQFKKSERGLLEKIVDFVKDIVDSIVDFFTNKYTNVSSYNELIQNMSEGRYQNRLSLNLNDGVSDRYMDIADTESTQLEEISREFEIEAVRKTKISPEDNMRINAMFNNKTEQVIIGRKAIAEVFENSIFSTYDDVQGSALTISDSIRQTVDKFRAFLETGITEDYFMVDGKHIKDLSPNQFKSLDTDLTVTDYIYSKIIGETELTEIDTIVDFGSKYFTSLYKDLNKQDAKNIQYVPDAFLSVDELTSFGLKQIMDSIEGMDYDIEGENFTNGRIANGSIEISGQAWHLIRERISEMYFRGDYIITGNPQIDIETLAKNVLKPLAIENSRIGTKNRIAQDIYTIYDMFYGLENSYINKLNNFINLNEIEAVQNFWNAFITNFTSTANRNGASFGFKGLTPKRNTILDNWKKKIIKNVKRVLFYSDSVFKDSLVNKYSGVNTKAPFRVVITNISDANISNKISIVDSSDTRIVDLILNKNGEIGTFEFAKEFDSLLANKIESMFKSLGITISDGAIKHFYSKLDSYQQGVNKIFSKQRKSEEYFPALLSAIAMSTEFGAKAQYIKAKINDVTSSLENINKTQLNKFNKNIEIIKNGIDDIVQSGFVGVRDIKVSKAEKGIASINNAISNIKEQLSEQFILDVKTYANNLSGIAKVYNSVLKSFNGYNYINTAVEQSGLTEEEITELEVRENSFVPSPLNFDMAINVLHQLTDTISNASTVEYIGNNKKMQVQVQATNATEILNEFTGNDNEIAKTRNKYSILTKQALVNGEKPSMSYNNILKKEFGIKQIFNISEMKWYSIRDTKLEPADVLIGQLIAFNEGIKEGNLYVSEATKGDSNKTNMYDVDLYQDTRFRSLMSSGNRDAQSGTKLSPVMNKSLNALKNNFITYHIEHIKSVDNFYNAISQYLSSTETLDGKQKGQILAHLFAIKAKINNSKEALITAKDSEIKNSINNYNFGDTIELISETITILNNSNNANLFNDMLSLGLTKTLDIKGKGNKIELGTALGFNHRLKKVKDSYKSDFTSVDNAYIGRRLYRSQKFFNDIADAKITEESYIDKSFLELNPTNNDEMFEQIIYPMFGGDMINIQRRISSLMEHNKIPEDTAKMLKLGDRNIAFYANTDEGNREVNWTMTEYFMIDHIVKKAMSHAMFGHDLNYDGAEDFYNRNKSFFTNGIASVPSNIGLGNTYKSIILSDSLLSQSVSEYNMLTGETTTINEILEATDGQFINTFTGRHFMLNSFGGDLSGYTSNDLKPIYASHNISTGETSLIKDAEMVISKSDVNNNKSIVALEYIALKKLDQNIADNFINRFNQEINKVFNYGEAFEIAANEAIESINNLREDNPDIINNLVVSFGHPSGMKKGRTNLNTTPLMNQDGTDNLDTMLNQEFNDIILETKHLRMIFNPDSQIENSSEVLAKQAFWLNQGVLNTENADKLERALANSIRTNIRQMGIKDDGSVVSQAKSNELIRKALETTALGMSSTNQIGTTVSLIDKAQNDISLMQLPNVSSKVISSFYNQIAEKSSKLKFKGGSYNQVSDVLTKVYDVKVKLKGDIISTITTGDQGIIDLQKKLGPGNVEIGASRRLKNMDQSNGNLTNGEAILQTVSQHQFGIKKGVTMIDAILIKANGEYINIKDIDDNGMYNGKKVVNSKGNIDVLEESVMLQSLERDNFKSDLDMITKFNKSLKLQLYRKPTSLINSGGIYDIIEFRDDNTAIVSSKKNAWDNSDFDIDKLYGYEYDFTNTEFGISSNDILDMYELGFKSLAENGTLHTAISTSSLDPLTKDDINNSGSPNTLWSSFNAQEKAFVGAESISRWANVQVTSSMLAKITKLLPEIKNKIYNSNYKGKFKDVHNIVKKIFNDPFKYEAYIENAIMLQAAVDNVKEAKLGKLGISRYAINEIVAMQYDGWTLNQIKEFMTTDIVNEFYTNLESANLLTGISDIKTAQMSLASIGYKYSNNTTVKIDSPKFDKNIKSVLEQDKIGLKLIMDASNTIKVLNNDIKQVRESMGKDVEIGEEESIKISEGIDVITKYNKFKNELEQFAYYFLQKYAMTGDIIRELTFLSDVLDGTTGKINQINQKKFMIEKNVGMNLQSIDFSNESFVAQHTDKDVKRLLDYDITHNDYFKKLDTASKQAYMEMRKEMLSMVKFGNLFNVMPLFNIYGSTFKFSEQVISNQIVSENLDFKNSILNRSMLANGIGTQTNPSRYMAIKDAWHKTILHHALNRVMENGDLFASESNGKKIDLSAMDYNDSISKRDDFNDVYNSIDITKVKGGRELFVKRIPTYIMSLGETLSLYYKTKKNNNDESIMHKSNLMTYYNITESEIENIYNSMDINKGEHFINNLDTTGKEYNTMLILKDSKSLIDNIYAYNKVQDLFSDLPKRIKELLSVYEIFINGFTARSNSLYEVIDTSVMEKIAPYMTNKNDIENNIDFETFYDNLSTTEGVLYTQSRTDNNELVEEMLKSMDDSGLNHTYVKVRVKQKVNNNNYIIKKVTREQIDNAKKEEKGFDSMGIPVYNQAPAYSLPFSTSENLTDTNRVMKNLNEKNIYELTTKGYTTIEMYAGHNFAESDVMNESGEYRIYMTNANIPVRITRRTSNSITIEKSTEIESIDAGQIYESKGRITSNNNLSLEQLSNKIIEHSDLLKKNNKISPDGKFYYNEGSGVVSIRVSSTVNPDGIEVNDNLRVSWSDGNVADRVSKKLIPMILEQGMDNSQISVYMDTKKESDNILLQEFLNAVKDNYNDLENESNNPLRDVKDNKEELVKLGDKYIKNMLNNIVSSDLLNMVKGATSVKVLTDVRLNKIYGDKSIMGETDIVVLYKLGKTWNYSVIDTKTSNMRKENDTQTKVFKQIGTYRNMFASTFTGLKNSRNSMYHVDKLSTFATGTKIGANIINQTSLTEALNKDMIEHIRTIATIANDIRNEISSKEDVELIKSIQISNNEIKNVKC